MHHPAEDLRMESSSRRLTIRRGCDGSVEAEPRIRIVAEARIGMLTITHRCRVRMRRQVTAARVSFGFSNPAGVVRLHDAG